jgi:hypothetical protein
MPSISEYRKQLGLDVPGATLEKGSEFPNFGQMSEDPDYALRRAKASLFFDDDAKLEFLASQRFPNDPLAALRYKIVDGVIVYEDDDGTVKPEFIRPSDAGVLDEFVTPNLVPAGTFTADLAGGMIGAKKGFQKGLEYAKKSGVKNPYALAGIVLGSTAIGGFGGTLAVGGAARTARGLLADQFYNLPPEEIYAALIDAGISAGFSAIPFGAGPTRNVVAKFTGKEDALRQLLNDKKSVQGIIEQAKEYGIDLTVAEAGDIGTRAASLQYFLSRQPQIQKIQQFYNNRSQQIAEAVGLFADKMGSKVNRVGIQGMEREVADTAAGVMKELQERRKARATKLYDDVREAQDKGFIPDVDLSAVIAELDDTINNTQNPASLIQAAQDFKDTLFFTRAEQVKKLDANGLPILDKNGQEVFEQIEVKEPLTNLMAIHDRRTTDMEKIVKSNLDSAIAQKVIGFRQQVTQALDEADGTYALARRVYDPNKPNIDATARSAIGSMARLFGQGNDKQVARSIKEIFNPEVSGQSLRNARRVLQAADPEGFKNVKKYFINNKFDDFARTQSLEGGVPNFQKYFSLKKNQEMLSNLLEPDEFANFNRMLGFMDRAFNRVPRGGSPTQPLLAMEEQLAKDFGDKKSATLKFMLAAMRLPGRILSGQVGDDLLKRISLKQQEAYYDKLTDVLLDPNATKVLDEAYEYLDLSQLGAKQAATRTGAEVVKEVTEPDVQEYQPTEQQTQRIREQLQELEKPQASISVEDIFDPLPQTRGSSPSNLIDSPTLLPSDQDRELARRLQGGIGGLGAIA